MWRSHAPNILELWHMPKYDQKLDLVVLWLAFQVGQNQKRTELLRWLVSIPVQLSLIFQTRTIMHPKQSDDYTFCLRLTIDLLQSNWQYYKVQQDTTKYHQIQLSTTNDQNGDYGPEIAISGGIIQFHCHMTKINQITKGKKNFTFILHQ